MKEGKQTIIIVVLIVVIALVVCAILFSVRTGRLVYEKNIPINNIENIMIDLYDFNLEIKESTSDVMEIKFYGRNKEEIKVIANDFDLEIILNTRKINNNWFRFDRDKVIIYIPSSLKNANVDINSINGNVIIKNNGSLVLSINNINGSTVVNDITELHFQSNRGSLVANNIDRLTYVSEIGNMVINEINEYVNILIEDGTLIFNKINIKEDSKIECINCNIIIGEVDGKIDTSLANGSKVIREYHSNNKYILDFIQEEGSIVIGD